MDHKEISKKGGMAKSEAKTKAARKNASKPRGRWVTAISYAANLRGESGEPREGLLLIPGKINVENMEKVRELIFQATGKEPDEIRKLDSIARLI